jgi:hypothetical protein
MRSAPPRKSRLVAQMEQSAAVRRRRSRVRAAPGRPTILLRAIMSRASTSACPRARMPPRRPVRPLRQGACAAASLEGSAGVAGNPSRKRVGTARCGVRTVSLPPTFPCGRSRDCPYESLAQILKWQRGLAVNQVPSGFAGSSPALCTILSTSSSRSSMAEPRGATAKTWVRFPPAAPSLFCAQPPRQPCARLGS